MNDKIIAPILHNLNIEALNEMQEASIEANETHPNVQILSATGSGKTLAFFLPLIEGMDAQKFEVQTLIIVPSRELALQIESVFKQMGTGIRISACYGGHKREIEENNLIQQPPVIVGTPGRLADHIRRGNIKTTSITNLIIDEFDKCLEAGFHDEIREIYEQLPSLSKHILTSATILDPLPEFLNIDDLYQLNYLTDQDEQPYERLEIAYLKVENKVESTFEVLCQIGSRPTIVFCNQKDTVEWLTGQLAEKGISSVFYHGSMQQWERESALCKFRNGTSSFLITTDLASRGLDIPHIRYIVHYDLPENESTYTHRNGRTARMEASGTVILLVGKGQYLPKYASDAAVFEIIQPLELPEKTKWSTLHLPHGKKNKINKVDILGFVTKVGELRSEDVGLIEVKDFYSFVAVRKSKVSHLLNITKEERIKGKIAKLAIAK